MESERGAVYCTLLLSDHYLPGAMVLAHSLRDNGTRARLVALYTPDTLQTATVNELRTVYDELISVHPIVNGTPANLWLMDRPDLIATFTKTELWRLTQFEKIVYIDCDVVAVRAPDELLSLEVDFAAAPDVGWPDCFNSGLMVLRPNMQDYYALKALADRGISFDGADQGLLNMHFRDWHRLSFTYNCTPSANYQYIPAYKHFQSTISLIHFIGSQKPWNLPRQVVPVESPYNQLLGRWWAVYDRHYRPPFVSFSQPQAHGTVTGSSEPSITYGNQLPTTGHDEPWSEPRRVEDSVPVSFHKDVQSEDVPPLVSVVQKQTESSWQHHDGHPAGFDQETATQHPELTTTVPLLSAVPQYVRGEESVSTFIPPLPHIPASVFEVSHPAVERQQEVVHEETHISQPQPVAPAAAAIAQFYQRPPSPEPEPPTFEAPQAEWDASRAPPPLNSKPEGISLQHKTYTMSDDTNLFQPPPSYPEAPRNMYYQVPATKPEPQKIAPIFPWETRAPKPTRVFAVEQTVPTISISEDAPSQARDQSAELQELSTSVRRDSAAEPWDSYSRSNAWDEDPHIQRYIESMTQARRGKPQVISGTTSSSTTSPPTQASGPRPSIILTDFPTEIERPSLPVTPAPIQRKFSGDGGLSEGQDPSASATLPAAAGVPTQEDWNPLAQLDELRRRQSAVLEDPERLLDRSSEFVEPEPASRARADSPEDSAEPGCEPAD